MSKKFFLFFLYFVAIFGRIYSNISGEQDDFISIKPSKNILKKFFSGVFFTTKNGLKIGYYGSKFSKGYLLSFLKDCLSQEEEYVLLCSLGFDSLSFKKDQNYLEIQDSLNIESISFVVSYRDDNIIKTKVYDKNSNKLWSYYGPYLQVSGLNLDDQILQPICFKNLKIAIEKLNLHFLRLGYSYVDIGYEIVQNKKTRSLKIIYKIDLDGLVANTIKFYGGDNKINLSLKGKCPQYLPSIFEVSRNLLYLPQFKELIKATYHSNGYFDVSSRSYFDLYKKKINVYINSGPCFKINGVSFDTSCVDFSIISEKKIDEAKKIINSIFNRNSNFYSDKKIKEALNVLNRLCHQADYYVTFDHDKNFDKKEINVNFVFKRKNIAFKKVLNLIKCTGNSKISSNRIMSYLDKKLGDLVSTDDLYSLKNCLMSTGCFSDVNVNLVDNDGGYYLNINVKEGPLWRFGNLNITPYPELGATVDFSKKNVFDFGRNLDARLSIVKSDNSNEHVNLSLDFNEKLPNGKDFSFGFGLFYSGDKIKNLWSKDEKKTLIFDQDSGGKVYGYLTSEFLGFDHTLESGYRYFRSENNGSCYASLETNLYNYYLQKFDSYFSFRIDNQIFWYLINYKNPIDMVNMNFQYGSYLTDNEKIVLRLYAQVGFVFSYEESGLKQHHLFQSLNSSELGSWGPSNNNEVVMGGDSRIGCKASIEYDLKLSFMPDFLPSLLPYVEVEGGSIFNLKDKDISYSFISGMSGGVKVPIMNGQIVIKLYYFIPFHNNSGYYLTKKGFYFNLDFDMFKMISF